MPASETRALTVYTPPRPLTNKQRRDFKRDEWVVARGLKSVLDAALALKDIRDRRLYKEQYGSFEEYCARRWDISRPRGNELCAAAEVIEGLSAMADIPSLPENERQTRPLTRLKSPAQWRRAWKMAVKLAAAENRPVTTHDTEEAVQRLNGHGRIEAEGADGEPVFNCIQGDNADLTAAVARLYLPRGCRVADLTYGRGVFWRRVKLANYQFYKSDRITCPSSPHDFRQLPYQARFFGVVVFDPPYAHDGDSMRVEWAYNHSCTTGGLCHNEIIELYRQGMGEGKRILKPGGTLWVKCADEIEHSRQRRGHIEVLRIAEDLGLEDQDLFVLVQERKPVANARRQHHAWKNCSFLWVFRTSSRTTRRD